MSKLYFRYGTMNCGKSAILMQVAHNYEENNKKVIIIKPSIDTKGENYIESRIGLKRKVDILIDKNKSIKKAISKFENIDCILVDETQFLTTNQIEDLWKISKTMDIPVICYGLRADFQDNLFKGSEALFIYADYLEEMKTICMCGDGATRNIRFIDGMPVFKGTQVAIDGEGKTTYESMCRKCRKKIIKGRN